jgi:hypothetical protein
VDGRHRLTFRLYAGDGAAEDVIAKVGAPVCLQSRTEPISIVLVVTTEGEWAIRCRYANAITAGIAASPFYIRDRTTEDVLPEMPLWFLVSTFVRFFRTLSSGLI